GRPTASWHFRCDDRSRPNPIRESFEQQQLPSNRLSRTPTKLLHHVPNPLNPDGILWAQFLHDLLSGEVRFPFQYFTDTDACNSPAIYAPANAFLRPTLLRGGQANLP